MTTVYRRYLNTIAPDNGANKLWGDYGWNSVLPNGNVVGYATTDQYGIKQLSRMDTQSWENLIRSKNVYCSKVLKIEKTTKKNKYGQYIWKTEEPSEGWDFWHCGDIIQWTGDSSGYVGTGENYHIGLYYGPDQAIHATGRNIPGVGKECTLISKISELNAHTDPKNPNVAYYKIYKMIPFAPYKITYNLGGGTNNKENPKTYTSQTPTITLKNPTRNGFIFKGWYTNKDYKNQITQIQLGSVGNKTLYAKWEAIKYNVTYVLGGGTFIDGYDQTYTSNTGQTYQLNPTYAQYDGTSGFTNKWLRISHPVKEGYTFEGWTISGYNKNTAYSYKVSNEAENPKVSSLEQGKIKRGLYKNLASNDNQTVTFKANWKLATYNIKYDLDEGTLMDGYNQTYTSNTGQTYQLNPTNVTYNGTNGFTNKWLRISHPVKEGYTFEGWTISGYNKDTAYSYKVSNETENPKVSSLEQGKIKRGLYKNLASNDNQTVTFKANWKPVTYNIEYDLDGGTLMDGYDQTFTSNAGQTYQLNPTYAQYNGTNGFTNKWIRINCPVKDGYTFEGWIISGYSENTGYSYKSNNETENPKISSLEQGKIKRKLYKNLALNNNQTVTFVACWKPITSFDIIYNLDGGEMDMYPNSYSSANSLELPIPTKDGYTFAGWYRDPEFTDEIKVIEEGTTGNLELFAKWEI